MMSIGSWTLSSPPPPSFNLFFSFFLSLFLSPPTGPKQDSWWKVFK